MTSTDLTYAQAPLEDRMNWARAIAGAGDLVPSGFRDRNGSANPAKILLAAEYGSMIGLHPMAALTGINVIEGKPSPSPALMSALVRNAGHKLRVETSGTWKDGSFTATVTLVRSDDPKHPFTETWDADRAKRAGLLPASSPKSSWARYPEAMCKWRAMSAVCRDGAEDVLLGAHYVPEELGAEVNEAGEMVDITPSVIDRTPPRRDEPEDAEIVETPDDWDPSPWEDAIADAGGLEALRRVYRDAETQDVLRNLLTDGSRLREALWAKRAQFSEQGEKPVREQEYNEAELV